jgi:NodT family efflux transporter outer membrane factor (OMF) lipoprotein
MRKWALLCLVLCSTNCAPPLPQPDTQVTANAYLATTPNTPSFSTGEIPPDWWRIYGNTALDTLVATGLLSNPSLAEAIANLDAAAASGDAANGAFLPQIGLNPNATRAAYPTGPNGSPPYTIYSLTGTISYDPGLFGARHYTFENSAAGVEYQQAELDAARQSLIGNIVAAVISEAGYNAQIATTEQIITVEQNLLTLLNGEYLDGAIPKLNVLQQQSQIQATQATLYPLQTHAEEMQDRLAVLTGQLPAAASNPQIDLAAIRIPQQIPITLPSAYLANRPDLQAARAQVAAQNASLGIAVAHLYPDLTLSANGGYASESLHTLIQPDAGLWTLAANLLQPLYDGGILHARKRAAQFELAASLSAYREAVLNAFGEAADALQATQNDEAALSRAADADSTATQAYQLAQQQFALGAADYTTVLTAQTTASQQALILVQTRTSLLLDIALLQSAMAQ